MSLAFLPSGQERVLDALRGFAAAHTGSVALCEDPVYFYARERHPSRTVALVSGGGSGHEPLHAGFVGRGMLDAAVPGQIFASPHNRQVYEASRHFAGPGGVLHIVKNYTGDRINFGIAAERLRHHGIEVRQVLVDDDIATDNEQAATGRRGTGATVIVEKVLGAAADEGRDLAALEELGLAVARASRSVAVAAQANTSPHSRLPAFAVEPQFFEYGVGIHGEKAVSSIPACSVDELVERMCAEVMAALGDGPDELAVLVNGLGATTQLELNLIYGIAEQALLRRGCSVAVPLVGTLVPALDMEGFSLTVTRLAEGWSSLLRAQSATPSFPGSAA